MDRPAKNIFRGFPDALRERGMRVDHIPQLPRGRAQAYCQRPFMDEVRSAGAADMHTEDPVRCRVGPHLAYARRRC